MKRPTYLYLLYDHMHQLENWLAIINLGEFFAYELIQHAYLIERALQPRSRERIYISCEKYYARLKRYINQVEADNKEALLEAIRRFQIAQLFNISVARSTNKINLMEASDVICYLAESIIRMVTKLAFDDVLPKFNLTESQKSQIRNHFAVIAYGKLGGLEMDLTSDLDLIFLYHCPSDIDDPLAIYSRVVQKFNNIMQSPTYSGKLYDIDLRLRPDGTSGLLVSSIEAYQRYQHYSAWTWEHQALVRARWITGSENYIKPRFEKLRQNILNRPRDQRQLQHQIVNMRKKMQRQLIKTKQFDLKQSPGGLIDIEFLAQYFALYYGYRYPQISLFTDNIRIFHSMETAQILSKHECDTLIAIYCSYRSWIYERFVSKQSQHIPFDQIARDADKIQTIWQKWLWY
jgi:glutamate-ammonia-ligase adenylyltransferase